MTPRIVVTLAAPDRSADPALAVRKNERYLEAISRAGGDPIALDERTPPDRRAHAFEAMDGLLLSGGADIDPARYGQPMDGARDLEPERDQLEAEAFGAAMARGLPVLGICRGFQAINVFSGGTLEQHVDGHEGPAYLAGPPATHDMLLEPGSRLAGIVADGAGTPVHLEVNSYHHQAVRASDLAPDLRATAIVDHDGHALVEALEGAAQDRFLIGVQCHPERTESTPPAFERLFAAFVDAARSGDEPRQP